MNFIRKSLTAKALLLFTILMVAIISAGIIMHRISFEKISSNIFLGTLFILVFFLLIIFILDIILPINRVTRQVRNLLTGKNYQRIKPKTIDEIGIFTHFFNEITRDLEKISYDLKERRRMSSELDIAAQIQRDVFPKEVPEIVGLDIVAQSRSAAEVGGDIFDFLSSPNGNQFFIYTGDVTGHGVPAGLVMMMVDTLVHAMVSQGMQNGKDIMVRTNDLLTPRISTRLFMTTVMLRWDKQQQKMHYTGAGHEHILVYHAKNEKVEAIRSGGIALGMIPDISNIVQEKEIPLEVGDCIVLYTDGITEAKDQTGKMYDLSRLIKSLEHHGYRPSAESIFDNLTKDFANFVGEYIQIDDITMIVIKYAGKEAPTKQVKLTVSADEVAKESRIWSWSS